MSSQQHMFQTLMACRLPPLLPTPSHGRCDTVAHEANNWHYGQTHSHVSQNSSPQERRQQQQQQQAATYIASVPSYGVQQRWHEPAPYTPHERTLLHQDYAIESFTRATAARPRTLTALAPTDISGWRASMQRHIQAPASRRGQSFNANDVAAQAAPADTSAPPSGRNAEAGGGRLPIAPQPRNYYHGAATNEPMAVPLYANPTPAHDLEVPAAHLRELATLAGDSPDNIEQWRAARRARFPTAAVIAAKDAATTLAAARGATLAVKRGRGAFDAAARRAPTNVPCQTAVLADVAGTGTSDIVKGNCEAIEDSPSHPRDVTPSDCLGSLHGSSAHTTTGHTGDADATNEVDDAPLEIGVSLADADAAFAETLRRIVEETTYAAADEADTCLSDGAKHRRDGVVQGDMARGSDVDSRGPQPQPAQGLPQCRAFRAGRCTRGASCRWAHGANAGAGARNATASPSGGAGVPRACRYFLLGTCRAGAACPRGHGVAAAPLDVAELRGRSGLLAKLLAGDVKREVSITLQCLRYIVANNFFTSEGSAAGSAAAAVAGLMLPPDSIAPPGRRQDPTGVGVST